MIECQRPVIVLDNTDLMTGGTKDKYIVFTYSLNKTYL
jgi:hypothetical protein